MYPNREVFAESPLALVAAEIRFTDAARLRQQATKDEVTIALEERFPFAEPLEQTDFNLTPTAPPQIQQRSGVVLKNAVSTETLTIMSESLTYETTAYSNFDDLVDGGGIHSDFNLQLRQEADGILGAAIDFGVPLLAARRGHSHDDSGHHHLRPWRRSWTQLPLRRP